MSEWRITLRNLSTGLALLALATQAVAVAFHAHEFTTPTGSVALYGEAPASPDTPKPDAGSDCDICLTLVHTSTGLADLGPLIVPPGHITNERPAARPERPADQFSNYRSRAPPTAPSFA